MRDDLTPASGLQTIRALLADAERRLAAAGVTSPAVDAAELLAHVRGTTRTRLFMSDTVSDDEHVRFEALLLRRISRVPLQHLVGYAAFRRMELLVGPGVFVPRPETELVAEAALREVSGLEGRPVAVDLCSGSGAIGLALATEAQEVDVVAVEREEPALRWAGRNAERQADAVERARSTYRLVAADAVGCERGELAELVGRVDVVVTNPPYIPDRAVPRDPEVRDHDPRSALFGGLDGLDVVRGIVETAYALLRAGGLLVVEHGDEQGEAAKEAGVPHLLRTAGDGAWFASVVDRPDLNGRPRMTVARKR